MHGRENERFEVRGKWRILVKLKAEILKMKKALPRIDLTKIPTVIIRHERRYPVRFSKIFIAAYYRIGKQAGCSPPSSGVFENQSPTVVQLDLRCMPCMIARNLLLGLERLIEVKFRTRKVHLG